MSISLTSTEKEVIYLVAVIESIDSVVNNVIFELIGDDTQSQILFRDENAQRLFNIYLVDFLSTTDKHKHAPVPRKSYLKALHEITENPTFSNDMIKNLKLSVNSFKEWLDAEVSVKVYFPSINYDGEIRLSRSLFIKMCGNLSKHNILRSVGIAIDIMDVLEKEGVQITKEESMFVLNEFYEWFHDDILNYHGTTIVEFLNNIRWDIYEYLKTEHQGSITWDYNSDPKRYAYNIPPGIESDFGKKWYWSLMNKVKHPPHIRQFIATEFSKNGF
ncbi:MAG: hypothetical protein H6779_04550 [Candidatus Nomurabacteria bacterium]|nr:hypothetical protein [Candidatus Nomurabacteria bacterium]USN87646.1 MAG: hypothetical protein H6779_04550 [Candidatus Nomurabacteria bacterium]